MSKKLKTLIAVIIVLAVISTGYAVSAGNEQKETFTIGTSWPLTGNLAFMGEGLRNAVLLAKEQLKDTKYNYEFIFEDDQLNPKLTASAVNKLINIDKVDAFISQGSGPGHVAAPLAGKHRKIHFGLALATDIPDGKNNFVHWTSAAEHSKVMIGELQKRGHKKVAIFGSKNEDVLIHVKDFRERITNTGINVVTEQIFLVGEKDFRSLIAKAKRANPDIYLLIAMSPEIELLARQIREAGINAPLTTFSSFEATPEVELFEGLWYVSPAEPANNFLNAYRKKYNTNAPVCSGNAYDMFNLIVRAVENVNSEIKPTSQQIAAELKKIKHYKGAMGELSIDKNGIVVSKAKVKIIQDGKPVVIQD